MRRAFLLAALALAAVAPAAGAATFTVDSAGDGADLTVDGTCDAQIGAGVACTLRAAIQEANETDEEDTIAFDTAAMGTSTIQPASALPVVSESVILDGTPAAGCGGAPGVALDGQNAGASAAGLDVNAPAGSQLCGLAVHGFGGSGVIVRSADNVLTRLHVGTDLAGTAAGLGNDGDGIQLRGTANSVQGAIVVGQADGASAGVRITGAGATVNVVAGSRIGVDAAGNANGNGVGISEEGGAGDNVIGGTTSADRNVIGASTSGSGIVLGHDTEVLGNLIGTDPTGTAARPNVRGISVLGAGNVIGGADTRVDRTVGGGPGNLIAGNTGDAINVFGAGATGTTIQGNYIGTDHDAAAELGTSQTHGVQVQTGATSTTIGGDRAAGEGNVIASSTSRGVLITGAGTTLNVVEGNRIGTNRTGTAALPNDGGGVEISSGAHASTVGRAPAALGEQRGNVIAGNGGAGVLIEDADDTQVLRNRIGTVQGGGAALPNAGAGVHVLGDATGTVIGQGADGNLISGNTGAGVLVADDGIDGDPPTSTAIGGNLIGTSADGEAAVGNDESGIELVTATNTVLDANVVAANGDDSLDEGIRIAASTGVDVTGNLVGTDDDGAADLGNAESGITVLANCAAVTIDGNVVSGNGDDGITAIGPTAGVTITANMIGTNRDGDAALGNGTRGINAGSTTLTGLVIGGADTTPAAGTGPRNLVAGNGDDGVAVGAPGARVVGNYIGVDAQGTTNLANGGVALRVLGGDGTEVGGAAAGEGNVVAAAGALDPLVSLAGRTAVRGNLLGTGRDGIAAISTHQDTLEVIGGAPGVADNADGSVVAGNVLADGTANGITVGADDVTVEDNRIGLGADGTTDLGHVRGVVVTGAGATLDGNLIGGNGVGVQVQSTGAEIRDNRIGLDETGAATGQGRGIELQGGAHDATIAGNEIAGHEHDGIELEEDDSRNIVISANAIHANGGPAEPDDLGIDILGDTGDGPDVNDAGDADDDGPNGDQNHPVLTAAATNATRTAVSGTLGSRPARTYRVELFASPACDPGGHGEGETYLGATQVTTDVGGNAAFALDVPATTAGAVVTATATDVSALDPDGTSELSLCRTVATMPDDPVATTPDPAPPAPGPPAAAAPPPPPPAVVVPFSAPAAPKHPAKIRVLRAGIDDGVLDMLVEITGRAATPGAVLELDYESAGRHSRFTVPIAEGKSKPGGERQLTIRERLPSSQRDRDTGIVEVTYAGSATVNPDDVRLRAADGRSELTRETTTLANGRLTVNGTVTGRARGVVRIRLEYARADGSTGFAAWNARIDDGEWGIAEALTGDAAKGGHLSIQFTGYEPAGLRGEQTAKAVP